MLFFRVYMIRFFFVFEDALSGFSLLNDRSCSLERIVTAIFMMIITELLYFHIT